MNSNQQPVDELDEILWNWYTQSKEQLKARLLQWGTRRQLNEAKRMEYTVVKTIEATGKGADWRQTIEMYVKLREKELQASLKDGGSDE